MAQRRAWAARRPPPEYPLVQAAHRLGGQLPGPRDPAHRRRLTVSRDRRLRARRVGRLAGHEWQPLGTHPTAGTPDAMDLDHQPDLPGAPRQVAHPPLAPTVDVSTRNPATST